MTEHRLHRGFATLAARRRRVFVAAFLAGLVAALGQAPFGIYAATLAGLGAGFALWRLTPSASHAAWAGWGLGLGYFGLTMIWIVQPFLVDAPRHGWMAPFALVLMAGGLALFWALAGWLARWLAPGWGGGLAWALALGAGELARGRVLTGFPWGEPGLVWLDTPIAQSAAVFGTLGLTFVTFGLAAMIGAALVAPTRRHWPVAGALAVLLGLTLFGLWRAEHVRPMAHDPVRLRLVQPNAAQHQKWDPDYAWSFFDRQLDLTGAPGAPGGAPRDLVIWPESAVPFLLERNPAALAEIAATAAPATAIIGAQRSAGGRFFNSLAVLDPDGAPREVYDKHHLVPFGEYVPLGSFLARFGITGLAAQNGYGFSPGPGAQMIDLGGAAGRMLPLICYEAIFARDIGAAQGRADWMLQATNDAWYGTFSGPYQSLAQSRMRAIEFGLPLARAANTGVSAVIDAHGGVVARLELNQPGFVDADLPGALPPTFYARAGGTPLIAVLLALTGMLYLRRVRLSV